MRFNRMLGVVVVGGAVFLAACDGGASPAGLESGELAAARGSDDGSSSGSGDDSSSGSSGAGQLRLKCEVRTRGRSRISVDGKNLAAGSYQASVHSGVNSALSPMLSAVGDEVEFDFDSDPDDVAAGATEIAGSFISPSDPHVTASLLDAAGHTVVEGTVACRVRR